MSPNKPALIKYALQLRGYTQADVARECSVEATTVGAVIHGRSRSRKIEDRIASLTGLSRAELWPQWHGPQASKTRRPAMTAFQVAELLRAQAS